MIKMNKTCLFLIFTFVISWSIAAIFWIIRGNFNFNLGFTIMGTIYMFIPFISAILVKAIYKEPIMSDFLISFKINRWFFIAWLIIPIIVFCSLGVSILFPNVIYNPELTGMFDRMKESLTPEQIEEFKTKINSLPINFIWLSLIQGLIAGATVNALAAFGEETGWRGFLLKNLRDMRFFKAAIIIGFIWGIWHAPLILMGHNYPQHPQIGVLMMIVFCILLAPILQYLAIKAKSVIASSIAHGTLNAVAGISIMAVSGGSDLITGMMGIAGFITLFIFVLAIFVYDYFITKEKIMLNKISNYI